MVIYPKPAPKLGARNCAFHDYVSLLAVFETLIFGSGRLKFEFLTHINHMSLFNETDGIKEDELVQWIRESISSRSNIYSHGYQGHTYLYKNHGHSLIIKAPLGWGPIKLVRRLMLYNEYRVYQRLSSIKGIPACHGFLSGRYLILEFIDGMPIREARILDRKIFFDHLLELIKSLHEAGVAHSDLKKKDNLLVIENRFPCVIDFGTAVVKKSRFAPLNTFLYNIAKKFDYNAWIKLKYGRSVYNLSDQDRKYYNRTIIEKSAHKIKKVYLEIKKRVTKHKS